MELLNKVLSVIVNRRRFYQLWFSVALACYSVVDRATEVAHEKWSQPYHRWGRVGQWVSVWKWRV
jgi:hypothetical protein